MDSEWLVRLMEAEDGRPESAIQFAAFMSRMTEEQFIQLQQDVVLYEMPCSPTIH